MRLALLNCAVGPVGYPSVSGLTRLGPDLPPMIFFNFVLCILGGLGAESPHIGNRQKVALAVRRPWSAEEKRSICLQTLAPGVSIAQVARRYAMNANLILKWLKNNRRTLTIN